MNCTEVLEYIGNNCGSCDYNWSLHKDYIMKCDSTLIECVDTCGLETLIGMPIVLISIFIIFVIVFFVFVLPSMYKKKNNGG